MARARRNVNVAGASWASCIAVAALLLLAACGGLGGSGGSSGQPPPVSVTVTPATASLYADEPGNTWPASVTQQQFSATVNNGASQTVTWAVTGGSANGSIDANGLYTAPSAAPNPALVSVTATSSQAGTPGSATVTIETPTAVGTYSNIQVTAIASGGAAHTIDISLTVD